MLRKIESKNLGTSDLGWLRSRFHFSFADYYDPSNINFGVLRVINDDLVQPGSGFETHPHVDMEIISYVVDGELTHADSMGSKNTLARGEVQYMSAGTGIFHSEHNRGSEVLRLLQIWIFPDKRGHKPDYGDYRFDWQSRKNQWLLMASGPNGEAPIKINQDASISSLELDQGREIAFPVKAGRQAYLVQIEGASSINGIGMTERDGMEIIAEDISIKADERSHILVIEMQGQGGQHPA